MSDDDRTVFGQKLPPQPSTAQPAVPDNSGERTIFGMPIPSSAPAPAPSAQPLSPVARQPPQPAAHPAQQYGHVAQHPPSDPRAPQAPIPQQNPAATQQHAPVAQGHPRAQKGQPPVSRYGDPQGNPAASPPPPVPQQPAPPTQQPQYQTPPQAQQVGIPKEDTWFGGAIPAAQPVHPQNPQGWQQQPPPYNPVQTPSYGTSAQNWTPDATPGGPHFPAAEVAPPAPVSSGPKIAFSDALRGSGLNIGASSNPIIASATDLLVLLGRLRTGLVEMQAIPLRDHVVREINSFVQKASERNVATEDIDVARYALAATADDIVQTIPGSDQAYWHQFSMAAELLNDRSAGIGFFARLDQVMTLSHQRKDVLELMLTCLSLGFEGKFRTEPNGTVALTRLRNEIYQRFRAVETRPGQDMSIKWTPIVMGGRRRGGGIPLWIMSGVAVGMIMALFATLSWVLSNEAQASQDSILALHDPDRAITIEAGTATETEVKRDYEAATPAQLDRLQGRLSSEIEQSLVTINLKGDYIAIRLGPQLRFGSGSAELKSEFESLAKRIGQALEPETGKIVVEGHSDNIPLRGTGRYKSNEELSEARAKTVRNIFAQFLSDPSRASAIGRGPNDPIDQANTREARAKNRRVEILLLRGQ